MSEAKRLNLACLQIFASNPRSWAAKPLDEAEAALFSQGLRQAGVSPLLVHAPYLMNLASPDQEMWRHSLDMLLREMFRARSLGASSLIFHPGSHLGRGLKAGVARLAAALKRGLDEGPEGVVLAVENTSGGGGSLGGRLEELALILDQAGAKERVAFWLDTAHAFGAGYDLRSGQGVDAWIEKADSIIGLRRLAGLHLNDSDAPLASRRDHHQHLARGLIGAVGLSRVMAHPALDGLPGIMETPKKSEADDRRNLRTARRLKAAGLASRPG